MSLQEQVKQMHERRAKETQEAEEKAQAEKARLAAIGKRLRDEKQAREKECRDKLQAAQAERATTQAQAQAEQAKNRARAAWVQHGGDPADFESAWPEIHAQALTAQAAAAATADNVVKVRI